MLSDLYRTSSGKQSNLWEEFTVHGASFKCLNVLMNIPIRIDKPCCV
jgi:hypothetical protein